MTNNVAYRTVGEWTLHSDRAYAHPFSGVRVDATFTAPSGRTVTVPGFYDGDGTWRLRFSPDEVGVWAWRSISRPADPALSAAGAFEVTPRETRGFLRSTPGDAWGFRFESGEAAFLLGDTTYNLFGMAHASAGGLPAVGALLRRRAAQGFGLLRVRLPVSRFHPPDGTSDWQTGSTWPWGGSAQAPQFDRFNLAYFRTVDAVMHLVEDLGLGLEMVMEAWGFEFPFNDRSRFVAEWEDLWLRYLIARYDAFRCVYIWTLMNEYEFYPDGNARHTQLADLWALSRARWVKTLAPHGHIVAVHNAPQMPPFAARFAMDPGAIDTIMFQAWGSMGAGDSWLTAGIEEAIAASFTGWPGSAIFAEWGYERDPALPPAFPYHDNCSVEHTRRGAWRGTFCGLNVIHGFEHSWGPWMLLDEDQPGMAALLHLRAFFTEVVPFDRLRPAPDLILDGPTGRGERPLALASSERDVVAIYLPVGGSVTLGVPPDAACDARWFDPRTGALAPATPDASALQSEPAASGYTAPQGFENGHPWDWVLVLKSRAAVAAALGQGKFIT